jgi:MFS family permease
MPQQSAPVSRLKSIPAGIWALGFVSLLMDVSSEMIHALLPVYLVTVLGTSMVTVGVIEGVAEATASIVKIFSGALSDWLGKRKLLAVVGYGLAAFTKPVFPLASTLGWVVAARFVDRIGKGIRGAPRDALIADIAPDHLRGASFGLRQSLDTVGAFLGPIIAIALMALTANHFKTVFWAATIPAFLSLAVLVLLVREPPVASFARPVRFPLRRSELRRLGVGFWCVTGVAFLFTLARFSEAFLILRAQGLGLPLMWVPLVLILMNLVYAASAYPVGALSDRMNRFTLLSLGCLLLIAADLVIAFAPGLGGTFAGIALWGLHMGMTQGLLSALVADTAPSDLRGTAFGAFNLICGLALLAASAIAGALWQGFGPGATFLAGATFAALTLPGLAFTRRLVPRAAPSP